MNTSFLYDVDGTKIYKDDIVMCLVNNYYMYACGDLAQIRGFYKDNILLDNDRSHTGKCTYMSKNWKLMEKRNRIHFTEEPKENNMTSAMTKTLQVAFLIPEGMDKAEFMEYMNNNKDDKDTLVICCDTPHKLKAEVKKSIIENPSERWYHVNTGVIAEISAPPVTFRSW